MATLAELVNEVSDDIAREDLTSQCSDAVVMAIRHYDHKRWWFNEASSTFTTTASTTTYALPSDFRAIDYIEARITGDEFQEVKPYDFPAIKKMLEGTSVTGYPEAFAIRDEKLWLAYTPNDAYTVRMYYIRALEDLTAGASNAWTTDCKDLIRAAASRTVATRTLHDAELVNFMATIEQTELTRLLAENDRRVATNSKVTPVY